VLVVANLVATAARFLLYRSWVFGRRAPSPAPSSAPAPVSAVPSISSDGSLS
jgi:hypothetical protein